MASLFGDLGIVQNLRHRWDWVSADCRDIGLHHWALSEGFAFDASHGDRREVLARQETILAMRSAVAARTRASVYPSSLEYFPSSLYNSPA